MWYDGGEQDAKHYKGDEEPDEDTRKVIWIT